MNMEEMAAAAPFNGRSVRIRSCQVHVVKVNRRGNWLFVRLEAGGGLAGWGEASHGCGYTQASDEDDARMRRAVEELFPRIEGESPFRIEAFRQKAWTEAKRQGLPAVTAFGALEQAMWDLAGRAVGLPVSEMLGGQLRDAIPVYANINRATEDRSPEGFARNAEKAAAEGFRAIKLAPFDDFPAGRQNSGEAGRKMELGAARVEAVRRAIGPGLRLLVDCHRRFDRRQALEASRLLESFNLYWLEEPVDPRDLEDCTAVWDQVLPRTAGGELLVGREGFEPLLRVQSFDVIMPDVKHCGGILEAKKIAAMAETFEVEVSPHNPSGPVSTAASAQLCATLPNLSLLEYAWGEAEWRSGLTSPPETFENGELPLTGQPGLGVEPLARALEAHA